MKIYGRNYGFLFSVGAEQELAGLCPNGELRRLQDVMKGNNQEAIAAAAEVLCVLSRWHEKAQAYFNPDYEQHPLTRELLDLLPLETFQQLQNEALGSFRRDGAPSVEAEPPKKKEDRR